PDAHYSNGQVSSDIKGAELSVVFRQSFAESWSAYTRLGVSYQNIEKNSEWAGNQNEGDLNTLAALGLSYSLSKQWSLRGEYQFIDGIGGSNVQQADLHFTSLGLTYHFGQKEQFIAAPKPIVKPVPIVEPVIIAKPEPVFITTKVAIGANTTFDFGSSTIKNNPELTDLVIQLLQSKEGDITITGYTDSAGPAKYNQRLSEKRAQAIADHIVDKGISSSRIIVKGEGEGFPVASNETAEGRAENRRVDIEFEKTITEEVTNKKSSKSKEGQ
ncbi:OmpA family protein, partial [Aliivibrio salmonicida]|uniref:OmpA family protein n=1 Tax=Aliivibrio salmonicida TaxID=40269 RepID=UPI003D0D1470